MPPQWHLERRESGGSGSDPEPPNKTQQVSSTTLRYGAADDMGEVPCVESYEDDLLEMIKAYRDQQEVGTHFAHVRKKGTQPIETWGHASINEQR